LKKILLFISLFFIIQSCAPKTTITIYFSKYTDTDIYLIPIKRQVNGNELYKKALEELIKGPVNHSEGNSVLPKTTRILSVVKKGSILEVDFSKEILTDADKILIFSTKDHWLNIAVEEIAIKSIVNTLTEFPGITTIKILIEGQSSGKIDGIEIENFWGHFNLNDNFERDESVIR